MIANKIFKKSITTKVSLRGHLESPGPWKRGAIQTISILGLVLVNDSMSAICTHSGVPEKNPTDPNNTDLGHKKGNLVMLCIVFEKVDGVAFCKAHLIWRVSGAFFASALSLCCSRNENLFPVWVSLISRPTFLLFEMFAERLFQKYIKHLPEKKVRGRLFFFSL